jgi:hypothetical protein
MSSRPFVKIWRIEIVLTDNPGQRERRIRSGRVGTGNLARPAIVFVFCGPVSYLRSPDTQI